MDRESQTGQNTDSLDDHDSTLEKLNAIPDSHLLDNSTSSPSSSSSSSSEPFIDETEKLELPSFQCFDLQDNHGEWGRQPILESDNTLVQLPLIDQTSSYRPSTFYDGLLESIVYGSSGERLETNTDSEFPLLPSSQVGQTELTPACANTTEHNSNFETDSSHFGTTSPNKRRIPFDGDWIRLLLGEDRNPTQ